MLDYVLAAIFLFLYIVIFAQHRLIKSLRQDRQDLWDYVVELRQRLHGVSVSPYELRESECNAR